MSVMAVLILVVLVIVVGVGIAVRSRTSPERGLTAGLWCLASGLGAAAGAAMIGQATFAWAPAFDPPGWLRIMTFWMLPVGVAAAAILGALALKRDSGRTLGIAGLLLAVLSAIAFFAMLASVNY